MLHRLRFFFFPLLFVAALYLLMKRHAEDQVLLPKTNPDLKAVQEVPKTGFRSLKLEDMPPEMQRSARARAMTRELVKAEVFTEFHQWLHDYLHAPLEKREGMMQRGRQLTEARRVALKEMIVSDPHSALHHAVPPVVRQELPLSLVQLLEERVNEKAFFGVFAMLPTNSVQTTNFRREVRTRDGGVYAAHVFGDRLLQQTTREMSIVGIAVDNVLVFDERPVRIMEAGEIPNHPNNLTRARTLKPLDARGFVQEAVVSAEGAPSREVVETCPVSKLSTPVPRSDSGLFAAVAENQPVVEAAGEVHYLCSGGHIRVFEDELLMQEGGSGGPMTVTNVPTPSKSTGHRTNLLMRIAFPETLKPALSETEGYELGKNIQDWMLDVSSGRMTFATTVTPTLVLPRTEAWYIAQDPSGNAGNVLIDARVTAKLAGFDTANYDFDAVIYTGCPGSFGGQAAVGAKDVWLKSGTSTGVACHEYGHNFGVFHANYWSTSNGSAIGGGKHIEYGDLFDTMGNAQAGDYYYNACFKNLLNWLPLIHTHDVISSGTYRIHQVDQSAQDSHWRYALRLKKDSSRSYWVEYRQKFLSNIGIQNGVLLHWSGWASSAGGTHLLDATPSSSAGTNDAALMIGRTFSDYESDLHITPVAKNNTVPPSMDLVVNMGPFPGNTAPSVAVSASTLSVAALTNVTFTASVIDAQGDALSYAWDFDRDLSGIALPGTTNTPTATYQWNSIGLYRVRCVVSDMKGKTGSASVVVQVGNPTMYRISGTITSAGQPVADVRVSNGGSGSTYRDAVTDSDGTYTLPVYAGNYTLTALGYGYAFATTTRNVTADVSGVNFTATELPRVSLTALDPDATEGGDTAAFRITRTGSTLGPLTLRLFGTRGTAIKGTDYTFAPNTTASGSYLYVDIPSTQSQLDITVTALADALAESFETATLELAPNVSYTIAGAATTVTLADTNSALPLVTLNVTDRDGVENGDTAQVIVQRLGNTASPLDVQLDITGTATNGVDYNLIPAVVTIPANASSIALPITPIQDTQAEALETLIISVNNDAAYVRPSSTAAYTGTIYLFDDDAAIVTVVATDSAAAEAGNDPGVFTLSRTGDIALPLNVLYGLTGSAMHGVDYGRLTGDVTFAAGSRTATVTVTPVNDTTGEPAQTVVLQIRSGGTYDAGTPSNATITITDNADLPSVTLDVMTAPAVEGGSAGAIRVTTTGTGAGNITINYTLTGTATNGTDYTTLSGALSMARNATATLSIAPIQDALNEGMETITLTLIPDPAYSLSVDSSVTLMLQDDELPQVHISGPNNIWTESPGAVLGFYVSRTGATTNALTVNCTLAGNATAGLDFTWATHSVTIPAGATGAYLSAYMLADTVAEGTETIILNLAPGTGYSYGIASATGYIYDEDSAATARVVGYSAIASSISEGAGTVLIPVALDAPATSAVTLAYNVNGGTASGAGIDYALSSGSLTFAPGETLKNISVLVNDDPVDEPDETLAITLAPATNAHFGISTHTLTITDNDAPPPVTIGFASATSSVSEAAVSAAVPVALSAAQASAVTVNYAVTGGTATNGTDYSVTAGTITFAPGETTMLIPISIIDDLPLESNETILLTLSSPTLAMLNANTAHTLTILDNDTVTLSIVATDANAGEPADTGTFTITRTGSTASAVTVNLTRSGTATNATDYNSLATTATIAATQTQTTITVTPIDDLVREGNETVVLTLASGSYVIGSPSSATVTIVDDEALLSITATDANADEAGDPGAFTLSRVGPTTNSLSINVTISGTASSGSDYVSITVPVVIPANSATAIIDVTPVNDSTPEPSETVIATIVAGPYGISGLSVATVTITDDEPFLSVTASDANARENVDPGAFTITRTGSITNSLAVNVTLSGTAINSTDYTTITSPIIIPALQTSVVVSLTTINDATQEGYETATLTLNTSAAYTLTSSITASITIQDDDINNPPVITVTSPTNRNIALTNTVHGLMIEATVVDDVGPVTNAWSVISSPAGSTVNFDNSTSPTTGARFSALGTYLLRLTASDGLLQSTYELHIAIGSPVSGAITAGDVGIFDPGSAAGSYSVNGTSITMSGSGTGLTNDATDGFYFLRQVSTSNALDVIVRVDSISGGANGNGRAGIMFRDGTGSGDFSAFIGLTNNGRLYWHTRLSPSNNATVVTTNSVNAPRYLRLTRTGDTTFSAYHSADGISWSTAMTATVNTVNPMVVGLAVASANTSTLTATFTNVSLPLNDNRGPVPNAGVDRSARINTSVSLSGSRPDDAKPLIPGFVTSQWVKMSGPGTANVADPAAASTTATFNLPGSYTMRLVANDGEVKTYDEMVATITQDIINIAIIPGNPTPNEVGNAPLYVEITRTAPTANIFVPLTLTGTATAEVDYQWPTTRQFFLQQSAAAYGSWGMYLDNLVEGTETATLTMLPSPEYTLGPNSSITWDILDAPVVTLTATVALARENGPVSGTVSFTRNGPTTDPLTLAISTSGTATSGLDYISPPTTLIIPANAESTSLDITPLGDFFNEPDETIIVTATGGTAAGVAGPATLTLRDSVTVTVVTQNNATEAGLIPGSYTLTRIGPADLPLPISIQLSGSATNGLDVSNITLNPIIPINETTLNIPVVPLTDSLSEGTETLTLTLLSTSDYQATAPSSADLLITDRHLGYWKQNMFGPDANNPLIAADEADPDRDGLANLLEYALGRLPLSAEQPQQGITHDLFGGQQRLTLSRDPLATDVSLEIQRSTTLGVGSWGSTNLIIDQNTATVLQARDTTPLNSRSFLKAVAIPTP